MFCGFSDHGGFKLVHIHIQWGEQPCTHYIRKLAQDQVQRQGRSGLDSVLSPTKYFRFFWRAVHAVSLNSWEPVLESISNCCLWLGLQDSLVTATMEAELASWSQPSNTSPRPTLPYTCPLLSLSLERGSSRLAQTSLKDGWLLWIQPHRPSCEPHLLETSWFGLAQNEQGLCLAMDLGIIWWSTHRAIIWAST